MSPQGATYTKEQDCWLYNVQAISAQGGPALGWESELRILVECLNIKNSVISDSQPKAGPPWAEILKIQITGV